MSSFSYQYHHPILHDSVFMAKNNMSGLLLADNNNMNNINNSNSCLFSQLYSSGNNNDDNIMIINNNTSPNVKSCGGEEEKKQSNTDSYSTIVDNKLESSGDDEQVTQKLVASLDKKRKSRIGSSSIISNNSQLLSKEGRGNKKRKNGTLTTTTSSSEKEEKKVNNSKKNDETKKKNNTNNNNNEEPPSGYIHVRARRGQATDSHSLAERVRREKISERMKMLQRLVPGCEKVTGKALMLDEIINYVQSLQNQVEFLSMKLASLNPMFYDFGMDIDTFMVRPEGLLMASQIPSMPQCTTHENNNNINSNNNYQIQTLIENSPSLLVQQQGQRPNVFPHDNVSHLWDMEDQRQSFLNPSGFISNLCSFN